MSFFKNATTDETIANERDSTGMGPLDSDIYLSTIKLAYGITADSGAKGLVLHVETESGREHRETIYLTSGTAKGGRNYYEKDGKKNYLPGFVTANALALLTVGKEISDLDTEDKMVKVYNKAASAEVPTKVPVLTDLLGQQVYLGILKETRDKNIKDESGNYVPSGETRDQSTIDKVFRAKDQMTTAEVRAGAEEAAYFNTWLGLNKGQVRDRSTKDVKPGLKTAPKTAADKPTKSLFSS